MVSLQVHSLSQGRGEGYLSTSGFISPNGSGACKANSFWDISASSPHCTIKQSLAVSLAPPSHCTVLLSPLEFAVDNSRRNPRASQTNQALCHSIILKSCYCRMNML